MATTRVSMNSPSVDPAHDLADSWCGTLRLWNVLFFDAAKSARGAAQFYANRGGRQYAWWSGGFGDGHAWDYEIDSGLIISMIRVKIV